MCPSDCGRRLARVRGLVLASLVPRLAAAAYFLIIFGAVLWLETLFKSARTRLMWLLFAGGCVAGALVAIDSLAPPIGAGSLPRDPGLFMSIRLDASQHKPFGYIDIDAMELGSFTKAALLIGFESIGALAGGTMGLLLGGVWGWADTRSGRRGGRPEARRRTARRRIGMRPATRSAHLGGRT